MAITATVRTVTNGGLSSSQTDTLGGAREYTAGNWILVLATATRNGHTAGLDAAFGIDDDASTNDPTWTEVDASTTYDPGGDFGTQTKAWLSDELTATESFTITIDGNTGDTNGFFYGAQVVELAADGDISVTQSDDGGGSEASPDVVFGSTPSGYQLAVWSLIHDGTASMPTAPTNFAKVSGGVSTASGTATQLLESSTNTSTTVSYAPTTSGGDFGLAAIGIEFAESGGGTVEIGLAAETDTALAVTASAGAVSVAIGIASETDSALAATALPGAATVSTGIASETDTALAVAISAGAVSTAVGIGSEADTALALAAVPGAVVVSIGIASETDTAPGLIASPGEAVAVIGVASETDTALAIGVAPGAAAVALGIASETDTALAITASIGASTVAIGIAAETDTALTLTVASGAATVALGLAVETDTALTITASTGGADPNAITITIRDLGHQATLSDSGHQATIRDAGHQATIRENP